MDEGGAIDALSALAQPTRLAVFKLLVAHEPDGLPAGEIARDLTVPPNTLSAHLSILSHAGLVTFRRHGRSIVYRVELKGLQRVLAFLLQDCCKGSPAICAPLVEELTCCSPVSASHGQAV